MAEHPNLVDEDGLTNEEEAEAGSNPVIAVTGEDGLLDGCEVKTLPTDALVADSDGLLEVAEVNRQNTDPVRADTDGDKRADGREIANEYNPRVPVFLRRCAQAIPMISSWPVRTLMVGVL